MFEASVAEEGGLFSGVVADDAAAAAAATAAAAVPGKCASGVNADD